MLRIIKGTGGVSKENVDSTVDRYINLHKEEVATDQRLQENSWLVKKYYDMATDFYEYGWGQSFHFAPRYPHETFQMSLARHEHYLALMMGLKPGDRVLDLGCGVGGPAREIARFTGAHITGINVNDYQLQRFMEITHKENMQELVNCRKADFQSLPFPDNSVDACYQIEATCHAADLVKVFSEIKRVLKPGGVFAGYEWVLTDKYDASNPEHVAIKRGIMEGNGLADIRTVDEVLRCARAAGLEVTDQRDVSTKDQLPWYNTLGSTFAIRGFTYSAVGRWTTGWLVRALEALYLAPKGTVKIQDMLMRTAVALVRGGQLGIFSATHLVVARKSA